MASWWARLIGGGSDRAAIGVRGERVARRFVRRLGFRVLGSNVAVPERAADGAPVRGKARAEADLVCVDPDGVTIVIVEVKARLRPSGAGAGERSKSAGVAPEAQVGPAKQRQLVYLARRLARANRWEGRPIRIDVVAVEFEEGRRRAIAVRHHPGAVRA